MTAETILLFVNLAVAALVLAVVAVSVAIQGRRL
jgi:hypothetical protein